MSDPLPEWTDTKPKTLPTNTERFIALDVLRSASDYIEGDPSVVEVVRAAVMLMPTSTPCRACIHVDVSMGGGRRCGKWKAAIPDDVLPKGCNAFEEEAPF